MNIFEFLKLNPSQVKVHLAVDNSSGGSDANPLNVYFDGRFKEWQQQQSRKNFGRQYILSLIKKAQSDEWLFVGIYKVKSYREGSVPKYIYDTELTVKGSEFIGRLIVEHKRQGRNSYLNGENFQSSCRIHSILPEEIVCADFESFKEVLLKRYEFEQIFKYQYSPWKSALSSVSGIYLLSDTSTGKLYVGSAYGEKGIWGRWEVYSKNYHGDNDLLKELYQEKGKDYFYNFQYSILETCDINLSDEQVIAIETRWKKLLLSKEFGYNKN